MMYYYKIIEMHDSEYFEVQTYLCHIMITHLDIEQLTIGSFLQRRTYFAQQKSNVLYSKCCTHCAANIVDV